MSSEHDQKATPGGFARMHGRGSGSSQQIPVVGAGNEEPTVISKRRPTPAAPLPLPTRPAEIGESLAGHRLGHFQLEEFIGGGGMGAVFRAIDTTLGRTVAVKVVSNENADEETLRRFRNEAQSAARLDHPNIARVYFVGADQGWNYIVFEYIEGVNIRDLVEHKGPLSVEEAISYTLQVADALEHANQRDVVHRDIKPSNILVMPDGRAKLVDMGLARLHHVDSPSNDLTATGVTLGTFDYISPEQARDPRSADVRSDLYSLGCTLYFMLTGTPPFPEGTVLQKLLSHSSDQPPDLRELRPGLNDELAAITLKLMAKQPIQRYQRAQLLATDLVVLAHQLGLSAVGRNEVTPRVWTEHEPRSLSHHLPWLVPIVFLPLGVVGLEWLWQSQGLPESPPRRPRLASADGTDPNLPPRPSLTGMQAGGPSVGAGPNGTEAEQEPAESDRLAIAPAPLDQAPALGGATLTVDRATARDSGIMPGSDERLGNGAADSESRPVVAQPMPATLVPPVGGPPGTAGPQLPSAAANGSAALLPNSAAPSASQRDPGVLDSGNQAGQAKTYGVASNGDQSDLGPAGIMPDNRGLVGGLSGGAGASPNTSGGDSKRPVGGVEVVPAMGNLASQNGTSNPDGAGAGRGVSAGAVGLGNRVGMSSPGSNSGGLEPVGTTERSLVGARGNGAGIPAGGATVANPVNTSVGEGAVGVPSAGIAAGNPPSPGALSAEAADSGLRSLTPATSPNAPMTAGGGTSGVQSVPPVAQTLPTRVVVGDPLEFSTPDVVVVGTLRAAMRKAAELSSVEAIELAFQQQKESPLELTIPRKLTIRAAAGYQPILILEPDANEVALEKPMVKFTGGRITLEGIHFRIDSAYGPIEGGSLFRLDQVDGLRLVDCTLTFHSDFEATAAFISVEGPREPMAMADEPEKTPAVSVPPQLTLLRCVVRGRATLVRAVEGLPVWLDWEQGLFSSTQPLIEMGGLKHASEARTGYVRLRHVTVSTMQHLYVVKVDDARPVPPELSIRSNNSVFAVAAPLIEHRGVQSVQQVENRLSRVGESNFYAGHAVLWRIVPTAGEPVEYRWQDQERLQAASDTLPEALFAETMSDRFIRWAAPVEQRSPLVYEHTPQQFLLDELQQNRAGFDPLQLPVPRSPALPDRTSP